MFNRAQKHQKNGDRPWRNSILMLSVQPLSTTRRRKRQKQTSNRQRPLVLAIHALSQSGKAPEPQRRPQPQALLLVSTRHCARSESAAMAQEAKSTGKPSPALGSAAVFQFKARSAAVTPKRSKQEQPAASTLPAPRPLHLTLLSTRHCALSKPNSISPAQCRHREQRCPLFNSRALTSNDPHVIWSGYARACS